MGSLFHKFQEALKVFAKSPTFAKDGRRLQFEADINRLFLYTSHYRLGKDADEADAEEIIEMASEASVAEQQKQVQENIHLQISNFCKHMDGILVPDSKADDVTVSTPSRTNVAPRPSGLGLAVGRTTPSKVAPGLFVSKTKPITKFELSARLKEVTGYTLEVKPSQIQHKDAGNGLFLDGEVDAGSVVGFYPGVTYSPAYYQYIPGYPRVDLHNPYLITRYDGIVIDAQPWGYGGESLELWDGSSDQKQVPNSGGQETGSDRVWKMLSRPLDGVLKGDILERRNPLALAHFANHPAKGMTSNVMVSPYDFPLNKKDLRAYIPNISFGNDEVNMSKFGRFWFKSWKSNRIEMDVPMLKCLVLVATRGISNEEILLNYRLSNLGRRPSWYVSVDEDEDRRRWS